MTSSQGELRVESFFPVLFLGPRLLLIGGLLPTEKYDFVFIAESQGVSFPTAAL